MKLLRIDSSARNRSVSRQLTEVFKEAWKMRHPACEIAELDLTQNPLPPITDEWSAAIQTEPSKRSRDQTAILAVSEGLVDSLLEADQVVIGAPMYNFSISAQLKAWIDQIVRPGRTVEYGPGGPRGLASGKRVVVLTSRGGSYRPEGERRQLDFQEPYLRTVFSFIGIGDVTFIHAENQLRKDQAENARASAINAIREYVLRTA